MLKTTGFRIAVYASVVKLVDAINQLGEGFQNKAVEFQDILKMGRTQLRIQHFVVLYNLLANTRG
jgi:aspartate ammonia-lyase